MLMLKNSFSSHYSTVRSTPNVCVRNQLPRDNFLVWPARNVLTFSVLPSTIWVALSTSSEWWMLHIVNTTRRYCVGKGSSFIYPYWSRSRRVHAHYDPILILVVWWGTVNTTTPGASPIKFDPMIPWAEETAICITHDNMVHGGDPNSYWPRQYRAWRRLQFVLSSM